MSTKNVLIVTFLLSVMLAFSGCFFTSGQPDIERPDTGSPEDEPLDEPVDDTQEEESQEDDESLEDEDSSDDDSQEEDTQEEDTQEDEETDDLSIDLSFENIEDAKLNSSYNTSLKDIGDISENTSISITGDGNPEFRVEDKDWTTAKEISSNKKIQLRAKSSNSYNETQDISLEIEDEVIDWSITAKDEPDTKPDEFSFNTEFDVEPNTQVTSNSITIEDIESSVSVSITGDGSPEFRINQSNWTEEGEVSEGDTIQLKMNSPDSYGETHTATLEIGGNSADWKVTAVEDEEDDTPDTFSIDDIEDSALDTRKESENVTVTGFDGTLTAEVEETQGDGSPELSVNGSDWKGLGDVEEGDKIQLAMNSSNSHDIENIATLSVGDYSVNWSITTKEEEEDDPLEGEPNSTKVDGRFEIYDIDGDNVVLDTETDLVWKQELGFESGVWGPSGDDYNTKLIDNWNGTDYDMDLTGYSDRNFEAAKACADLDYAGYSDWRLPMNKSELRTIVCDEDGNNCGFEDDDNDNFDAFTGEDNDRAWTADGSCDSRLRACVVVLASGSKEHFGRRSGEPAVTCVR